ncbi:glycosyl hydrolase family 28-related protein [Fictibacillus nanhaiensis]|uniref:glycosyl hydrolase family 28-related protein n=1 Tax=Fictibacillus nanhaiensis TaxID=742169 RepID=UPI002E1CE0B5|nr:glycosyl hydrolase family 28-related protein [Fictibacillus nanhaiensis]
MISLDKHHDPLTNKKLIGQLRKKHAVTDSENLLTSENLFRESLKKGRQRKGTLFEWLKYATKSIGIKRVRYYEVLTTDWEKDEQNNIFPRWISKLNEQYEMLYRYIKEEANVLDYGAVGDGVTDNTEAFRKAIGKGRVIVRVPEGKFVTKGIKLPSWTILLGEGKGKTTLQLHEDSPKAEWLVTNKNHFTGNRNIAVKGMTLDWNVERLKGEEKTSAGNNRSSCLTFANVTYGWMFDLEAVNSGLHGFDVSSSLYTYLGDGTRSRGGSKYIWLDNLNGHGFGDDGITTHHSEYIFISNSHMSDPSGRSHKKGYSNSNGIEIDDGSHNVWLLNNSTARCFGGVEVKAHHNASAATNVHIYGHLSVNDNRSYNFRHIGHHKDIDPESKTAHHISATNLLSVAPIYTELYKDSTPRSLVVSGYNHVVINGLTVLGDRTYNYEGQPVIAIQYRARNVILNDIIIKDFTTSGAAVKVYGGPHRASDVTLKGIRCDHNFTKAIDIASDIEDAVADEIVIEKETSNTT